MLSFFCPCIQVYRNANALRNEHPCLFFCGMFTCLHACYDRAALRGMIRTEKGIKGSLFMDWLCVNCCFSLSLVQESQVNCCCTLKC